MNTNRLKILSQVKLLLSLSLAILMMPSMAFGSNGTPKSARDTVIIELNDNSKIVIVVGQEHCAGIQRLWQRLSRGYCDRHQIL